MEDNKNIVRRLRLFLVIILLAQLLNMFYWCCRKEGYYIDELWSYGLANSYYEPFLHESDNCLNRWNDSEFYMEYLSVGEEECFSFDSVFYNQEKDVHPPLYYVILHVICSLFPGVFSKWFGLIINLLSFAIVVWLLYLISGQILGKDNYMALIPPLCYGFSVGAIIVTIYIRMYMLMTLWTLLYIFLTNSLLEEVSARKRRLLLVGVFVTVVMGFLTHYHFVILAGTISAVYLVIRLVQKRWKDLFSYAVLGLMGIGCGIALFPRSIFHIFGEQDGKESLTNAARGLRVLVLQVANFANVVVERFFGIKAKEGELLGIVILGGIVILSVIAISFVVKRRKKAEKNCLDIGKWCICTITLIVFFVAVAVTTTGNAERYLYSGYPLFVLLLVLTPYMLAEKSVRVLKLFVAVACVSVLLIAGSYGKELSPFVYTGYKQTIETLKVEYQRPVGVYVTGAKQLVIHNCLFLEALEESYILDFSRIDEMESIMNGKESEELVVCIDICEKQEEYINRIAQELGYRQIGQLYDNEYTQIYILQKQQSADVH